MASATGLMARAVDRTGLDDFGDDSFREGLEILTRALRDEARLNARGEGFVYHRLELHLSQRLQVEDWYRRHPEIDEETVVAPLFGLGLPRSGSTALSFLLAQDPDVRYLRSWESAQPCPPPSTVQGDDPRIPPDARPLVVGSRHHVPNDIRGPMECLDLMALDFKSQIFQAYAQIPSYSQWLCDKADFTSTYVYERRVLKLLQWAERPRPWRLKSPAHVLSLAHLDRVFRDARFVMTHRDPTDVMLSVVDVYADIVGGFTDHLGSFSGTGLRIRRQGVRKLEGFWGHCWQSALFGSGRAFGYIAYPPRPDAQPNYNEGYVDFGDGALTPARVVDAPWLRRLRPHGEDVSLVLETDRGTVRISGETVVSTHDITDRSEIPADQLALMANWTFPALQQAGVRYRWDGEEAIGMLERSSPMDQIEG